ARRRGGAAGHAGPLHAAGDGGGDGRLRGRQGPRSPRSAARALAAMGRARRAGAVSPGGSGGAAVARPPCREVRATLPAGEVRAMFDRIAPRYDLLNRLMTLGLDRSWRRQAAAAADLAAGQAALDCCTGTGDLAFELADRVTPLGRVVGIDFAEAMLERARDKAARQGRGPEIRFEAADAEALPFADGAFDAATAAFGVRNVGDLDHALAEMARVVRPG